MTEPHRTVVIADDHALLRRGLADVIRQSGAYQVVAETGDGLAALELARQHRPSVIILDIEMPGMTGLQVAESLRDEQPETAVVLLTMHDEPSVLDRALELAVRGYVLKDGALADIVTCLNLVSAGRQYVSSALTGHLLARRERIDLAGQAGAAILQDLTPTERRVLRLVAQNFTTARLAGELGMSPKTAENHRARIAAKLGVRGPQALLRFALENRDALAD